MATAQKDQPAFCDAHSQGGSIQSKFSLCCQTHNREEVKTFCLMFNGR